jgi:hypothetical protein
VLHIKHKIAPLIFSGNVSHFATNYDQESEAEFQKLLKFDTNSRKYPKLAPMLYPDLKNNAEKIFCTLILVKVCQQCFPLAHKLPTSHWSVSFWKEFYGAQAHLKTMPPVVRGPKLWGINGASNRAR